MESKGVLLSLPFVIQFVLYNTVGYGIILYIEWDELGKFYDRFEWYELWFPCALATLVSMFSTSLMAAIEGDW